MNNNIETLVHLLHFFVIVAAIPATVFPIVYAFVPWYSTALGRVLMLHAVALALALDSAVYFRYFKPESLTAALWIDITVFGIIALANIAFTLILFRSQMFKRTYDGTINVHVTDDGKKVYSLNLESDPDELDKKNLVIFRIEPSEEVSQT